LILRNKVFRCGSDIGSVRHVLGDILQYLVKALPGQSPEDLDDVRLIFNELINNAVEHGNAFDGGKLVRISVSVEGNKLAAYVEDEGKGFDYMAVLAAIDAGAGQDGETGRGIKLVRAIADEVTFNGDGNKVGFFKTLGK